MAISFSKELPTDELLASHNNNIVRFSSNSVLTAVSCLITVAGVPAPISPDPDGEFEFNFVELMKSIVNLNKFRDEITPDIDTSYSYLDPTLYKAVNATFKISFEGGSTEEVSRTYHFSKSIRQAQKYDNVKAKLTDLHLMLPPDMTSKNSNRTYYAVYSNGFPFDVSLYSNQAGVLTIKNKTNSFYETVIISSGVNRIFFSQGNKSVTTENFLPLIFGINEIEFQLSPTKFVTLFLEKRESVCSPYLKFINNQGGYSYIKFNKNFYEDISTKTIKVVESDLEDISETNQGEFIIGKDSKIKKTFVIRANSRQLNYLIGVIGSPRVELYQELIYQKQDVDSFYGIRVLDATYRPVSGMKNIFELKIVIQYKLNTLSL